MKKHYMLFFVVLVFSFVSVAHAIPVYVEGINNTGALENSETFSGGFEISALYIPSLSYDLTLVKYYTSGTGNMTIFVKEDSSGVPGSTLGQETFDLSPTSGYQGTEFVESALSLVEGIHYWVGFIAENTTNAYLGGAPTEVFVNWGGVVDIGFSDLEKGGLVMEFYEEGTQPLGTQPVPEPATMLLLGSGLLGLAGIRRKLKKS